MTESTKPTITPSGVKTTKLNPENTKSPSPITENPPILPEVNGSGGNSEDIPEKDSSQGEASIQREVLKEAPLTDEMKLDIARKQIEDTINLLSSTSDSRKVLAIGKLNGALKKLL